MESGESQSVTPISSLHGTRVAAAAAGNHVVESVYPLVEVTSVSRQALQVHVECRKRPGLMENLVVALEASSLLLEEAQISVHEDIITLDVLGLHDGESTLTMDALRSSLLEVITNANNNTQASDNNIHSIGPSIS